MTFDTKKKEAEKVLAGEKSEYLNALVAALNENAEEEITVEAFAGIIKAKADAMVQFFIDMELWKNQKEAEFKIKYNQ